jgi:hypothetical protein
MNWFGDSNLEPWLFGSLTWLSTMLWRTGVDENGAGFCMEELNPVKPALL